MKTIFAGTVLLITASVVSAASFTATFEDAPVPAGGTYAGPNGDGINLISSSDLRFGNASHPFYFDGTVFSSVVNTTDPTYANQFGAIPGGGAGGSSNYGVFYDSGVFAEGPDRVFLPVGTKPVSVDLTNTTLTYLAMKNGISGFVPAKKFGGATGSDPDFLRLTLTGFDADNVPTGTVEFYLADFRFADDTQDYIVNTWTTLDLTPLGDARSVGFAIDGSDNSFGFLNTPGYFAMDNFTAIPEPSALGVLGIVGLVGMRRRR